jgi:glycosyltransferase involved in cell wall biosynthesis
MPEPPEAVLLVTPRWTRDGGVGAHVRASAAALARAGVSVGVLAARADGDEPPAGVSVFESPSLFDAGLAPERRLGEAAGFPASAIHVHQVDDPQLVEGLRERAPVLVSAHAYTACTAGVHHFKPGQECERGHGPGCWPNLLVRGCAHTRRPHTLPAAYRRAGEGLAALRGADLAVCYSSAVDRHLAANRVPRRAIVPLFATTPPKLGIGHATRRRVLFAGRVVAPKGLAVLIEAIGELDAELVVCGEGWRLQAMRRLARRLGVERRVRFAGWLGAEALAQELADASVVAIPSLWPEPFGLVGIEALAAGRPVVASAGGGIGDWLQDGVNGLSVPPGEATALARALGALLDDPARQERMGSAGRRMVADRFSPERHVAALSDAYRAARGRWEASV